MGKNNKNVKSEVTSPENANCATVKADNLGEKWNAFITPFASAIGKKSDDVTKSLQTLIGEPSDEAIALLQSEEDTPASDIQEALKGLAVPKALLNKAIKSLRKKEPTAEAQAFAYDSILPAVPDDVSFLAMLKTGGILKIGTIEVISAIRAALANRTGLYDLPNMLVKRMEAFADEQEEPCAADFYKLRKLITKRNYSEIFAVLEIDGASAGITQEKKDQLLKKLDASLWTALNQFNQQVVGWMNNWQQGAVNPTMLMAAIVSGGKGMPAGMMQSPPTNTLRTAAEGVINKINKVFAGTGMIIARALAYDASNIKAVLENPGLPVQLGAANREQMLKMLGVNVSSDYVLLEQNITRYTLAIMELPKQPSGDREISYLSAMFQLGNAIPWDTLNVPSPGRISRTRGGDPNY